MIQVADAMSAALCPYMVILLWLCLCCGSAYVVALPMLGLGITMGAWSVICKYYPHPPQLCIILNAWIRTTKTKLVLPACS